ncbi:hypothetical protein GALL_502670 [mine drainage metagenome]|uniref:Uncharacterized protein n=1 Tax=mine drainage metagenome TaxID=410659 RepID=A0A1J5PK12_9ZZZZ
MPVIEVAGDDERSLLRHLGSDVIEQALGLPLPAHREQPEVHHDAVQRPALRQGHLCMQQAALLEAVIRHIAMRHVEDGIARQQRVAMLAVAGTGVGAIGRVHVQRLRQEVMLRLLRPEGKAAGVELMQELHFLQKHQIGLQALQGGFQFENARPFGRAVAKHTLVDVVGRNAQVHDGVPSTLDDARATFANARRAAAVVRWRRRSTPKSSVAPPRATAARPAPGVRAAPASPACPPALPG